MLARDWLGTIRRYLCASLALHFVWEMLQLPLYTLWTTGTLRQQAFAIVHCTGGDAMIAAGALLLALILFGRSEWPAGKGLAVYSASLAIGVVYTAYSEWYNTTVSAQWAYANAMPIVPFIGVGLTPLLQWIVVPTLAMWSAQARAPWTAADDQRI